jgi:hypothetical protein
MKPPEGGTTLLPLQTGGATLRSTAFRRAVSPPEGGTTMFFFQAVVLL